MDRIIRWLPALRWLTEKRTPDGRWRLENVHKGQTHLEMETKGEPSRWMTLKALTILRRLDREPRKGENDGVQS